MSKKPAGKVLVYGSSGYRSYWDPWRLADLSQGERRLVAIHEELHFDYAARRDPSLATGRAEFKAALDAFVADGKQFRDTADREAYNRAVDEAVSQVVADVMGRR